MPIRARTANVQCAANLLYTTYTETLRKDMKSKKISTLTTSSDLNGETCELFSLVDILQLKFKLTQVQQKEKENVE